MKKHPTDKLAVLAGVTTGVALFASSAFAQSAAPAENTGLEEVQVTATRQINTANKVAMSIAAVTQTTLDQVGIKTAQDLATYVPALTLVNQTAGVSTFAIRGIVATTGAATTGVYIDDTALTKRNNPGVSQNNGAPTPLLFDLQRVEVLKGPQGTLYGGSSQGGTIRFITPTPSFTRYSGAVRAEVATTQDGAPSYEMGAAIGGPLVENQVGFRFSAITRNTGGWIDTRNVYDGGRIDREDANGQREWAMRGALAYNLGDKGLVNLAYYHSQYRDEGGPGGQTEVYMPDGTRASATQTFTTPAVCFNNSTRLPTATNAPAAVACPTGVLPTGWFRRESQTYGPFGYLRANETISPNDGVYGIGRTMTDLPSLTIEYELGSLQFKSVTSLVHDRTNGDGGEGHDVTRSQQTLQNPGRTGFPLFRPVPVFSGRFISQNERKGVEQEFRLSSPADARLSWVAGAFFSKLRTHINYTIYGNYDAADLAYFGLTSTQRYGVPNPNGYVSVLDARLVDSEYAVFGEANYAITDKLKATAGVRWSQVELDFKQQNFGQLSSRPDASVPYASVAGQGKDKPLTPKYGLQYQLTPGSMLYATAAKGFRAGGANVPLNPQVCATGLALFGITVDDIPKQYGPDLVMSYEVGGKFRMFDNTLQVNVAAFQIDWTDIQVTNSAQNCGQNWNQNGGKARSTGYDLQVDYRPIQALTINAALGVVDAKYREAVTGPKPLTGNAAIAINKGDPLGVPDFQANGGARFEFAAFDHKAYVRADYIYQGSYLRGVSYGAANYNPYTRNVDATDQVNARLGVNLDGWDVNLYANNLLNGNDKVGNSGNGKSACNAATGGVGCTVYGTYSPFVTQSYQKPRTIGLQANYKF